MIRLVVFRPREMTAATRALLLAAIATVFSVAYSVVLARQFEFNNVDDAYIAFRYGRNLMDGHGLVFNPGEWVEGYTSPLWTVLLAPFTKLEVDIVWFSVTLGLVASVAALWGLFAHVRRLNRAGVALAIAWAIPLLAVDNTHAFWAIGGMEAPLFTALVLWSSYAAWVARSNVTLCGAGLLAGLATLARPEGALITACLLAHRLLFTDRPRREAAILAAGFAFVVVPHLLVRYVYYGEWLPNTFHNKVGLGTASLSAGWAYFWSFLQWRYWLPLLALLVVLQREWRSKVSLHALIVVTYAAYIVAVGGDWPVANRFFAPVLPFLYLLVVLGLQVLRPRAVRWIALALCLGLTAWGTYHHAESWGLVRSGDNVRVETQRKRFGIWLRGQVDPATRIATGPSGAIPYYSRLPAIDIWGLTDKHISSVPRAGFEPGHDRSDIAYVLSRRPAIIVGAPELFGGIPPGYRVAFVPEEVRPLEPVLVRASP